MERPRVKLVYPPIPLGNGRIRIGGADHGIAAELVDDEQEHVAQLLRLLDGSRSLDDLVSVLQGRDPELPAEDVLAVVDVLASEGYLEDAADEPSPSLFAPAEVERYRRNFDFFSHFTVPPLSSYEIQGRLKQARVTVLGLGGLGSFVALGLASAGVGHLRLVDDDVVEPSNLNRQVLYTEPDVGRPKADAAAARLREVNPHVALEARHLRVGGIEEARTCLADSDLLICAADRPRVRIYEWLNAAALAEGVPWMRGANGGLTVNLFLHVPRETACFECEQMAAREVNPWYDEIVSYAVHEIGDRTVNPCTAPVAGLIGNLACLEAVKHLTGVAEPVIRNRRLVLDLRTMVPDFSDGVRRADCPACGMEAASAAAAPEAPIRAGGPGPEQRHGAGDRVPAGLGR